MNVGFPSCDADGVSSPDECRSLWTLSNGALDGHLRGAFVRNDIRQFSRRRAPVRQPSLCRTVKTDCFLEECECTPRGKAMDRTPSDRSFGAANIIPRAIPSPTPVKCLGILLQGNHADFKKCRVVPDEEVRDTNIQILGSINQSITGNLVVLGNPRSVDFLQAVSR